MDYSKLLTRAFEITRTYRALWLFGVLLALFGGGGGGFNFGNFGTGGGGGQRGGEGFPTLPTIAGPTILLIVGIVACIVIIWLLLSIILRFVSRAALIGLVQELEASQTTPTVRRGFSIGFARFWSLLVIALVVNIPLFIVSFALIVIAALPLIGSLLPLISSGARRAPGEIVALAVTGMFGSIALLCCVVLFLILVGLVIRPFYEFFVRACVIGKRGALDSIREGYRIVRANPGNVAVLYILVIAIGIGFGLLMIPVALVLIGVPVGAAFAVYLVANSIGAAIGVGALIGIPMLLLMLFIYGLYQVFESAVWTEGYLAVTVAGVTT